MARPITRTNDFTIAELKKMSTERLLSLHVRFYGAYPINPFDRVLVLSAVWNMQVEGIAWAKFIELRSNDHNHPQYLMGLVIKAASTKAPKFSDHDVSQMRIMKRAGYGYRFIATTYGTSPAYAKKIVDRKLYKNVV